MRMRDGREVVTDEWAEGLRYNAYDCPGNGRGGPPHAILSADVDDGVTPFVVRCPICGAAAMSRMYRVDALHHPSLFPVRMVWRRATGGERKRERRDGGDHFAKGGLAREWVPIVEVTP